MITIVIPTCGYVDDFVLGFSLQKYQESSIVSKIVLYLNVDNPTLYREWLPRIPKLEIVEFGYNKGVNPVWNQGVEESQTDIVGLMNDDIFIDTWMLEEVVSAMEEKTVVTLNEISNCQDNLSVEQFFNLWNLNCRRTFEERGRVVNTEVELGGYALFVKKSFYDPVPSMFKYYCGDAFLIKKAKRKGMYVHLESVCVGHLKSFTAKKVFDSGSVYQEEILKWLEFSQKEF